MSKLEDLAKLTNCSFHLEFNPHKSLYETVADYIKGDWQKDFYDHIGELDVSKDIWTLQIYPRTPVGFIAGVSNNLDDLIDWGIQGAKDY